MFEKSADSRGFKLRTRTQHDRSSNEPSYYPTRPRNYGSLLSGHQGHQPTLTPQSLRQHTAREDKLHQNPHHIAATRIEQTQRLQQGLQSLGVDIPSDLYQTRVSGYAPYNYNGEAPPTNNANVPCNDDDDEMNDILSDGQLFIPTKNYARPLPDAYAMQGMPRKANYFAQDWLQNEIPPAHGCVTMQTLAPTQSYSNNYRSPTALPSASDIEENIHLTHLTHNESTYAYNNIDHSQSNLNGIGEQFASYDADMEKTYQGDVDSADCGW